MCIRDRYMGTSAINLGLRRVTVRVRHHDPVPDAEWWDAPLLRAGARSYIANPVDVVPNEELNAEQIAERVETIQRSLAALEGVSPEVQVELQVMKDKISHLIEHPAPFRVIHGAQPVSLPMYLTKEERKKLRRQKRAEKEQERRDKLKLGLIQQPPPKLKMSNFMHILGTEAIGDPSKLEAEVKKNMAERLKAHLERNAQRSLTKEQRAEKLMRKLKRDSSVECRVAVFRIERLTDRAIRFKVDKNAQQLALNGVCLISNPNSGLGFPSMVVVEGGPKAIKFYKRLLLRRIKWEGEKPANADGEAKEQEKTKVCNLVWEGALKDHSFTKWKVVEIRSEIEVKRALTERSVEHYWDLVLNYKPPAL
eukprot:TRINITY_DN694_c0_g1_i2.p1 TRINITY_DN694_c0_g1~~TRINITY_DN694_c0_g1_i2.p1  ORF type:complete len:388 (+),score=106.40 TRINITY_DN694_c0_g1_i2:69-1166(+)